MTDASLLLGRVCLVALFLFSGIGKLGDVDGLAAMLGARGLPAPSFMAWTGALLEVAAAVLVLVGLRTREAAAGLIGFTVFATLLVHDFWTFEGGDRESHFIHFWKNVGLAGGFLLLIGSGPGRLSVDGHLAR